MVRSHSLVLAALAACVLCGCSVKARVISAVKQPPVLTIDDALLKTACEVMRATKNLEGSKDGYEFEFAVTYGKEANASVGVSVVSVGATGTVESGTTVRFKLEKLPSEDQCTRRVQLKTIDLETNAIRAL